MILYLTTADTDILSLSKVQKKPGNGHPEVTAHNLTQSGQHEDLWDTIEASLSRADLVVMRLLGGRKASPLIFDRVVGHCQQQGIPLLAWPGDLEPSSELQDVTTVDSLRSEQAMRYAALGGRSNFAHLVCYLSDQFLGTAYGYEKPVEEPWHGIYWPGQEGPLDFAEWQGIIGASGHDLAWPTVAILFYRAHWLSGNTGFVDALVKALIDQQCLPLPIFAQSLTGDGGVEKLLQGRVHALVVTMSFATVAMDESPQGLSGRVSAVGAPDFLMRLNVPVFQAMVSLGEKESWERSDLGLGPLETAMNVAVPEFDGRIITVPVSFRESPENSSANLSGRHYIPAVDRVESLARLVAAWMRLKQKAPSERKIAFVLTNYPSKNSRIGNAVGLDTPKSLVNILRVLGQKGYDIGDDPVLEDSDALIHRLIRAGTHDLDYLSEAQMAQMVMDRGLVTADYLEEWTTHSFTVRDTMSTHWGDPPGERYLYGDRFLVPGLRFGNIFIGIQPPRAPGEDEVSVYHSPDKPPSHHYVAYYQWIRHVFGADAVVHLGKHGTLEWLPGKAIGLSRDCFPEVALDDLPNFYPFVVDDPGEGTQAKRRSHAVIIDHMVPPVTTAGLYDELVRMQQLLDQYYQAETLDPSKLSYIREEIWALALEMHLNQDLDQTDRPHDDEFGRFLVDVDGYLCELEAAQIRDGLHVFGEAPESPESWGELLFALARLPLTNEIPSLPDAVSGDLGMTWADLQEGLGLPFPGPIPPLLESRTPLRPTKGDVRQAIETLSKERAALSAMGWVEGVGPQSAHVLDFLRQSLVVKIEMVTQEPEALEKGLAGGFVEPGPSGAPTRGMTDVLPTGRNFYSVDPRGIPSQPAWAVGQRLADDLIRRYREDQGEYPESVGIVVWGTAAMRTGGDDVAEVLALLGVRPKWQQANNRIDGLEVIPLDELDRPRVDVTVRVSGFFRDAFRNVLSLIHQAVEMVAERDEPLNLNPVRRHVLADAERELRNGQSREQAWTSALYRVFGSKPGTYGSGILPLLHQGQWSSQEDLAEVYTAWSSYAYSDRDYGVEAREAFSSRMERVQIATKNQDNREHDIFDSDDYLQDHGGMAATVKSLTGTMPRLYFGDSSNPARVDVRSFQEEAFRVFRSRVVNPKWLESAKRHQYKGALEMANTMDFLFGYDATAELIEDWMYQKVADRYVRDESIQEFFRQSNPWALKDIAERLLEAHQRGLWEDVEPDVIEDLKRVLISLDGTIEEWGDGDDTE